MQQATVSVLPGVCDPILENHLAFLAAHRGRVHRAPDHVALEGAAEFLSFVSPQAPSATLPDTPAARWTYPWSGSGWPERLSEEGFETAERLSYMRLVRWAAPAAANDMHVELVRSDDGARAFANVQARGFLTNRSPHCGWWGDLFIEMALRNYGDPRQSFYLGRVGERPAAVLLALRTGSVTGIYAVATDPDFRRRGLSTALLALAIDEAVARGAGTVVLQAISGEYAESFYQRLGFELQYHCQVWRRP